MGTRNIPLDEAGSHARDVMLDEPKAFPPTLTVAEARTVFESPKQKLLLICDGARYVGAIRRDGLDGAPDDQPATDFLDDTVPVMAPDDPSDRVPRLVESSGLTRIPVVDNDGTLLGLVCFNTSPATFCVR